MKFSKEDQKYLMLRKKISDEKGKKELWEMIDHWPLYVGIRNLARYLVISDLLRSTLDIPGHIAEFGCWKGSNLMFMAKLLKILDPLSSKTIHCFDSFQGLSTFNHKDGNAKEREGEYEGTLDELLDFIRLYELEDDIEIYEGLIQDTLPKALENNPGLSFSFIYCDTDLYEPTSLILNSLHERLSKGGLFILDEWNFQQWPGESIAVNEFMKQFGNNYEMIHVKNSSQPSLVLKKIFY